MISGQPGSHNVPNEKTAVIPEQPNQMHNKGTTNTVTWDTDTDMSDTNNIHI